MTSQAPHLRLVYDADQASRERVQAAGAQRPALALLAHLLELEPTGVWTGSQERLATDLGKTARTVGRWTEELEGDKLLKIRRHRGQPSTYIMLMGISTHDITPDIDAQVSVGGQTRTPDIEMSGVAPRTSSSSSSSSTPDIAPASAPRDSQSPAGERGPGEPPTMEPTIAMLMIRAGFEPQVEVVEELAQLSQERLAFALRFCARKAAQVWAEEERRIPPSYMLEVARTERIFDGLPMPAFEPMPEPRPEPSPPAGDAPSSVPEGVGESTPPLMSAPQGRSRQHRIHLEPGERIGATDPRWSQWREQVVEDLLAGEAER